MAGVGCRAVFAQSEGREVRVCCDKIAGKRRTLARNNAAAQSGPVASLRGKTSRHCINLF
jgi:hypothetical protein